MVDAQEVRITSFEQATLNVEMLDISKGLSQGMISAVAEDKDGYLWIATKEGLNRYDGSGVKVFCHNPNDSLSLSGNLVTCLLVDEKNRLWVGTQSNGVNLFNRQAGSFTHFREGLQNSRAIPSDFISRLFLTPEGGVSVMSEAVEDVCVIFANEEETAASKFSVRDLCELYPVLAENGHCKKGNSKILLDNNPNHSCFSKNGDFWYHIETDSVYWYSALALKGKENAIAFPTDTNSFFRTFHSTSALVFNKDKSHVFLTDGVRSLKKFNGLSGSFEPYIELPSELSFKGQIFVDKDELIWADLGDNQLLKIDPVKGLCKLLNQSESINNLTICAAMTRDSYGNIWLPTNGYGVGKISSRQELFHHLSIGESKLKHYWVLRQERPRGKAICNIQTAQQFTNLLGPLLTMMPKERSRRLPAQLCLDENGNFLMVQSGIVSVNYKDGLMSDIYDRANSDRGPHRFVPMFFDRNNGLWFCSSFNNREIILHCIPSGENAPKEYRFPINPGPLDYRFLSDWHEDTNGTWWFATVKGLFSFNMENEKWNHYKNIEGDFSSLSLDITLSVCPDPRQPERFLWIGTEGRGLNKFDRKNETFVHYSTEDGLPNNVIYGIQSDDHNNLWLSTNRGLCLFNPETENVRNFTDADGLNGKEFNRYEYSKSADGTMYFGGIEGTTYFHPNDFYQDTTASSVVINGLKLINKPVDYQHHLNSDNKQYMLSAPMEFTNHLEFNHDVGMISLTFTMLDFTIPEQHQFRYQLKGLDKEWIESGNTREATYTNLSPGNYTFLVMGLNSNHIWSKPTKLSIKILPPWWATWWFRTIAVLVFASFLYGLYRYRMAHLIGMERMRNRIAQDLHDEIGSTLSSISLYSAVMQKSSQNLPQKTNDVLGKIINSTSEIMEKMNDMVWTIKSDNDDFAQVVNRMRAFAVNMTETKNIKLLFNAEEKTESLKLGMDKRKNIYLIYKEAVNNAVKYSNCKQLNVSLSKNGNFLNLEIRDDGIGFDLDNVSQNNDLLGGNGISSMQFRAKELKADFEVISKLNFGTTVVLSIPINH